ncbi:MAG: hypothetical protein PHR06_05240 [Candidatus Cloacimonetes bacterium]|nr:hypothetical protein [Candidatus Cloacimonadota bacterium]
MKNKNVYIALVLGLFTIISAINVSIYDIQYTDEPGNDNTYPSPYDGEIVTTSGVVTAIGFTDISRFFISMPEGGAWKSIYVYYASGNLKPGDLIEITGTVDEYYGFTELSYISNFTIIGSAEIPEPVDITTDELASSEAYESVLVRISNVEVTTRPNNYGEWYVNDGSGSCQIDDGFFYLDDEGISVTMGQIWPSITGIIDYSYSIFGLNPRNPRDMGIIDDFNVYNTPSYPNAGQPVQIKLDSMQECFNTKVYWRISPWDPLKISEMTETENEMLYHTYLATIPSQNEGTTVEYVVYTETENDTVLIPENSHVSNLTNFNSYSYRIKTQQAHLEIEPRVYLFRQEEIPIKYGSKTGDKAILRIFNSQGRLVRTVRDLVISNSAGTDVYNWDGRDSDYQSVPIGLYICHLEVTDITSGKTKTAKVPIVIGDKLK